MKVLPALALGLTALFLISCDEQPSPDAVSGAAPARIAASPLDDARFIRAELPVTTQDGRSLSVSFTAYCEKMAGLDNGAAGMSGKNEYTEACIGYVQNSLEYFAKDRACFEGSLPAIGADVRNHAGLPKKPADHCFDLYPSNYASFPEEIMRRTLEMKPEDNLYTVTKITPVAPR